ncbi:DUF5590 domain-containing protein [Carnobacteriaceae bacterium zg-C25]|nr:DUF5590 domain-containing protein [Carnobacteriaceae bacterium zg-ZUI240]QTU82804.1 DUF5590 domain-containing protein [Carnobacteriaceae bacterium zg-C25]
MKKILIYLSSVFVVLLLLTIGVLEKSFSKEEHARQQAISLVSEYNVLKQVEEFYWYRGQTETYTLYGRNNDNQLVYIVMDVKQNRGYVYHDAEIISRDAVMQRALNQYPSATVRRVVLGLENDRVIWELTYRLNGQYSYIVFDAKTGSVLHEIKNATNE